MYTRVLNHNIILEIVSGDITEEPCDAIVNPANSLLIMGGGVAGALKRKGGNEIEKEALLKAPVPVGKAIHTKAGKLKVKYIIHAPTMEKPAMKISSENVYKATEAALLEAENLGIESIAFPVMGAGVGGLKIDEAGATMIKAIKNIISQGKLKSLKKIKIIAYGEEALKELIRGINEQLQ
ncbi:MAG: macro domain-containing protein [Thermoprotei archaeon]|jgi:O-acetyl-ADP-ribose deacetylase (regulator of RNase III)